jgi:large subunit ribosomal protein L28
MGNRSASDEYRRVLQSEKANLLSPELLNKLTEAIEADLSILTESQKKPEWAHVYAFALMLVSENPQVPDNLVAAPRWFNTAMLVLESTAIWFSLNRPNALIHMQAIFETLLDTDILNKGAYQISIEEQSRCIRLFESYDLSLEHAMFRSPSDLAQLSAISYALLSNALPKSRYAVEGQTIQADLPVINAMTMVPLGINTIKTQTTAPKLVAQSSIEKQSEKPKMLLFSYMPGFSSFSTLLSVPRRLLTAIIRK